MVWTGRLGPKSRPHPYLGLSIFQDSDSRPAAGAAPNSGDSAGDAAPYRPSADASVQPLRFASLGSNRSPLHYPTSKASSFFLSFYICLYFSNAEATRARFPTKQMVGAADVDCSNSSETQGLAGRLPSPLHTQRG